MRHIYSFVLHKTCRFLLLFVHKKLFLSLDVFIISLESSFFIKGIWLALTDFFLIGTKLFNASMFILQNLLHPLSLLTDIWLERLSIKHFLKSSLEKCLRNLWLMFLGLCFLNVFPTVVSVIKWKSDSPVSITEVFWNVRGTLVRIKSMRVGLSRFL